MKKQMLILPLLLLSAAAIAPASAKERLMPVASYELNRFVGTNLHGAAFANLGTVSEVDRRNGLIGLAGRHGERAVIHTSLLAKNGMRLRAPALTVGHVAQASIKQRQNGRALALVRPTITIEEYPADE